MKRDEAQRRADQIRAFRAELATLATEGVAALSPDRAAAVTVHHDALLASLATRFDIDRTDTGRRMSLGMRLASAFGGAALVAAIVSFFYRIWGSLSTPAQVTLLTAAPLAALTAMVIAARRERTLYIASLCAIVASGAFVTETVMLGDLFNSRGSPHVLAVWAAFGLAVALPYGFSIVLAGAVAAAICYAASLLILLAGAPWTAFGSRLETVLVPAAAAYALFPAAPRELQAWVRGVALTFALAAILGLSTLEEPSVLPIAPRTAAIGYQILAAGLMFAVVGHGVRSGRRETMAIGMAFAALFLLGRFVAWWWEWMPRYLFFLILAAMALAAIWLLRRLRARVAEAA